MLSPSRDEDGLAEWGPDRIWASPWSISDRLPIFQALFLATLAWVSGLRAAPSVMMRSSAEERKGQTSDAQGPGQLLTTGTSKPGFDGWKGI